MSTAWYKPNRLPRKIRSWASSATTTTSHNKLQPLRSIEVWETTCVVTNMNARDKNTHSRSDENNFSVLINPGNPSLSGVSRFSYFPVGGPEPPPSFQISKDSHPIMGYVTSWGGMEVGSGMSFPSNTVDGIVHQHGGQALQRACERALSSTWAGGMRRLDEGTAIATPAVGPALRDASGYEILVHTVPPFCHQDYRKERGGGNDPCIGDNEEKKTLDHHNDFLLAACYKNSLMTAAASVASPRSSGTLSIACPLLGAGCRGFPTERAIRIAAETISDWMVEKTTADVTTKESSEKATTGHIPVSAADETANVATASQSPFSLLSGWWSEGGRDRIRKNPQDNGIRDSMHQSVTLAFGIPDGKIREQLIEAIDREVASRTS